MPCPYAYGSQPTWPSWGRVSNPPLPLSQTAISLSCVGRTSRSPLQVGSHPCFGPCPAFAIGCFRVCGGASVSRRPRGSAVFARPASAVSRSARRQQASGGDIHPCGRCWTVSVARPHTLRHFVGSESRSLLFRAKAKPASLLAAGGTRTGSGCRGPAQVTPPAHRDATHASASAGENHRARALGEIQPFSQRGCHNRARRNVHSLNVAQSPRKWLADGPENRAAHNTGRTQPDCG